MWSHYWPIDDCKPHKLEFTPSSGTPCECAYTIDWNQNVIKHAAFDGREAVQAAEELIGKIPGTKREFPSVQLTQQNLDLGPFHFHVERIPKHFFGIHVIMSLGFLSLSGGFAWGKTLIQIVQEHVSKQQKAAKQNA